jgi:hypothetical protein
MEKTGCSGLLNFVFQFVIGGFGAPPEKRAAVQGCLAEASCL